MALPETLVTLLRRHGKKLKALEAVQRYTGTVSTHWANTTHVMTMRTGRRRGSPPDLFNPVIAQMGDCRWRIQRCESVDGAGCVQEWMIDYN